MIDLAVPHGQERIDSAVDRIVIELRTGLPAEDVQRALVQAERNTGVGNRVLAFYLHELESRGLACALGFPTTIAFAVQRLEMSRRQARDLLAVGRALSKLPRIDEAFRTGVLTWSKVRLLVRIAVPETEEAWLEEALASRIDELDRRIARSEKGQPPRQEGKGLPVPRISFRAKLKAIDYAILEQAQRKLEALAGGPLSEGEVLRQLAEIALRLDTEAAPPGSDDALFRIHVGLCQSCRDAGVTTADGEIPLGQNELSAVACDARIAEEASSPRMAEDRFDPIRLQMPFGTDKPVSPALRQRILARDHGQCTTCGSKVGLHAHHVIYREHGGRSIPENLVTLCDRCHALVHDGFLRISGVAPHELEITDAQGRRLDRSGVAQLLEPGRVLEIHATRAPLDDAPSTVKPPAEPSFGTHRDVAGRVSVPAGAAVIVTPTGSVQPTCESGAVSLSNEPIRLDLDEERTPIIETELARAHERCEADGTQAASDAGPLTLDLHRSTALEAADAVHRPIASSNLRPVDLPVDRPSHGAGRGGAMAPPGILGPQPFVGLRELPEIAPAGWWPRYTHLFSWNDRRQALEFEPGYLRPPAESGRARCGSVLERLRLAHRPVTLDEVIGQEAAVAQLRLAVTDADAHEVVALLQLDPDGLGPVHQRILEALEEHSGPLGAQRLAAKVGLDRRTYRTTYEPDLLRTGRIVPSARGLMLA